MTEFPTTTPERVRAVLERHNLRQEDLAALMDPPVEQATVSRWLRGLSEPRPRHTLALRRLLGDIDPDPDPLPSRAEMITDWHATIAACEAAIARARAEGDESGVRLAESIIRVSRATLRQFAAE